MFYDNFLTLCKEKGVSPSRAVTDMGMNRSIATFWKNGTVPKMDTLTKMSEYFGVPVGFLINGYEEDEGTPTAEDKRPRRPIKDRIKEWKSSKDAHLDMRIDSDLLNWIKIFAGQDGISLEDEIEKILNEEAENRIEEWANEVSAREFAQMPVEMLYSSSWPASVASTQEAEQEQPQPEQKKMPTPVSEDGQKDGEDDLEQFIRRHKKNLTAGQEQKILEMMQSMIASQKQPLSISAQSTVDETSPKKGRLGNP